MHESFVPALDDVPRSDVEGQRLTTVVARIELLSVEKATSIMGSDLITLLRFGAISLLHLCGVNSDLELALLEKDLVSSVRGDCESGNGSQHAEKSVVYIHDFALAEDLIEYIGQKLKFNLLSPFLLHGRQRY